MPRIEEEERSDEPKKVGREEGYDKGKEEFVFEKLRDGEGFLFDLVLD